MIRCLLVLLVLCSAACRKPDSAPTLSRDPGQPASDQRIAPQGDIFPFMGYSGVPGRDARNGFSVAGPSYDADQKAKLAEAKAAGLRYPHKVGIDMKFHAKAPEKPLDLSVEEIKKRIAAQVQEVAADESICWWYLTPEELRHWRENEMEYLQAATEAIRAADPMGRPIWMYEPNHRDAASLAKTGRFLDIIGKGFYTNLAGYRDNRIWVRWSIEQETDAIESMGNGGSGKVPIVMPELCADPEDPSLDHLIPAWTRHDTYLGLMCGGKGVAIWSLFPRNEVKRTWRIWYDSYSAIARELTGPSGLGRVFLHGIAEPVVEVSILDGPKELALTKGARNSLETTTTSEAEKAGALVTYPALCVTQLRHDGHTYIFLCNSSSDATIKYQSTPLPEGGTLTDVFQFRPYQPTNGKLYGWIAPLEVKCLRFDPQGTGG